MGIKSVQHFTVTLSGTDPVDTTIEAVDVDQTMVLFLGSRETVLTGEGPALVYVELTSATNVRATRGMFNENSVVSFVVVEFDGGIKSIQRGTIVLDAVDYNTVTIDAVDTEKAFLTYGGVAHTVAFSTRYLVYLQFPDATTVSARQRGNINVTTVAYEVIEFI